MRPQRERGARPVVAGTDGSADAAHAVEWAARHAELLGSELKVCRMDHLPDSGRLAADEGVRSAADGHPAVPVELVRGTDSPLDALTSLSADCDLLVIGARGGGHRQGIGLGSLVLPVVARSASDVAVVGGRGAAIRGALGVITAAVGGPQDSAVLDRATRLCRITGARLRVLCAAGADAPDTLVRDPDVEVTRDPRMPQEAVAHLAGTDVLVVGRGRGPVPGPVTRAALYHASCPVVVAAPG